MAKKKSNNKWVWWVLGITVVILIITALIYFGVIDIFQQSFAGDAAPSVSAGTSASAASGG